MCLFPVNPAYLAFFWAYLVRPVYQASVCLMDHKIKYTESDIQGQFKFPQKEINVHSFVIYFPIILFENHQCQPKDFL